VSSSFLRPPHTLFARARMRQVWRDVLLTITTRDKDVIGVAPVNRWGAAARQAVRPMSEGTILRLLYTLEALYPCVLARTRTQFTWRLMPAGAAFVHMCASLDRLARVDAGPAMTQSVSAPSLLPSVTTELWPHQREARNRVILGIQHGKLGFADASAVGAGKTLTALACVCSVAQHLASHDIQRHGSLVLVPVNELVSEWVMQAMQHTANLHVIEQRANGKLFSPYYKRGNPPIDGNSLVISTLARVREHPFAKAAWDFVVIDECLSVQNDTALQTAEAWRQVEASHCGVLMLSATFFRSNYAKLFYMIRMLRSPLPREQRFLTTTLVEHIVCYVPKNRRSWKLSYEAVPLENKTAKEYEAILTNFHRKAPGEQDHRTLYVSLKHLLGTHYEPDTLPRAVAAVAQRLISKGRRPLIFANTEKELARIFKHLPCARRWPGQRATAGEGGAEGGGGSKGGLGSALVVTIHAAAQGLNMQHDADCIICRPQPGDRLEQMKGRIDRPGQALKDLELVVLMAASTVEEAEAANIRLCGSFFRHYIAPHSRQFEQIAIDASLSSSTNSKQKGKASKVSVHAAFRKGVSLLALGQSDAAGGTRKRTCAGANDADEDENDLDDSNLEGREGDEASACRDTPPGTPQGTPSKKTKVAPCPWLKAKSEKVPGAVPRKLAYDLSSATPAVLDRGLLRKAAVHLCAVDPTLGILIKRLGVTCVPTRENSNKELSDNGAFLSLVKGVVFQMISVQCGNAIMERMLNVVKPFTPTSLLAVPEACMCGGQASDGSKNVGLSRSKYGFIRGIASAFASGELSLAQLATLSDRDCCKRLCALKGIGEWTAGVFMLHFLNRPDIMLYGDLTVRMAIRDLYNLSARYHGAAPAETRVADAEDFPDTHATRHLIDQVAEKWRPYRTVVNHLMWHYKENPDSFYVVG
jgi:3-methyladenine DNA glycosylase/8-oxoguanine DNA glycosylase